MFVGGSMIIALLLATDAIRWRKFRQHGAWMIRTYPLAMGAGWLINILVAEWVITTRLRPTQSKPTHLDRN